MEIMEKETINGLNSLPVTLLTIAFVVLKLCKVIDWSWWWVLSPLWIGVLIVILICIVAYFYFRYKLRKKYPSAINEPESVSPNPKDLDDLIKRVEKIQNEIDQRRRARLVEELHISE